MTIYNVLLFLRRFFLPICAEKNRKIESRTFGRGQNYSDSIVNVCDIDDASRRNGNDENTKHFVGDFVT